MERQLIILCREDLVERVLYTLNQILDRGYLRLPNAVGIKPKEPVAVDTTLAFAAEAFLVSSADKIIHDAEASCLISNSIKAQVVLQPEISIAKEPVVS